MTTKNEIVADVSEAKKELGLCENDAERLEELKETYRQISLVYGMIIRKLIQDE